MTHRWTPDTWVLKVSRAVNLWKTHAQGSASFLVSHLYIPHCRLHVRHSIVQKVCFVNWRHVYSQKNRVCKRWLSRASQVRQRLRLHTSSLCSNTSASRWSAGLSQHMSRIKNTLDSVSKAIGGTHTKLFSKIARLKANATQTGKQIEPSPQPPTAEVTNPQAQAIPATPNNTLNPTPIHVVDNATTPSAANSNSVIVGSRPPAVPDSSAFILHSAQNVAQANTIAPAASTKRLRRVAVAVQTKAPVKKEHVKSPPPVSDINTSTPVFKTATPLFHPSSFSVNLDETYYYLAHHVNTYFGASTKADEKKLDNSLPSSVQDQQTGGIIPMSEKRASQAPNSSIPPSRKGIGHYLSYSAPTVQAFVGSYIAPLVPKFRVAELKRAAAVEERNLLIKDTQPIETIVKIEQTAAEEKAKRLLIQREKIIARVSVDNRTRGLVQALHRASDVRVYINRVEDLSYHLLEFPETRGVAVKEKVIPCLLRLRQAGDPTLKAAVRAALTLVGYNNPVKGRGIRVLSIDGGGTRGLIALQTLHKLEILTSKPIYQLFDYICGVSTGAILGFMLGVFQIPLTECEDLYRKLGSDVFKQNVIVGTVKMGWNHAFYESQTWENILKEKMGSELMVETARNPGCPKVAAVSTIVNRGSLKAYVFRNYNLQAGVCSHYLGGCQHKLWQALRASSAAPGYFQEFSLGQDLHQDGGLLMNNPTALAIHECKCLWPNTPVECVVSLGTGRFETPGKNSATYTSLKTKLTNVISSATDTEEVHTMLDALLPPNSYFRFNPYMNEDIALDESRHEKFNLLQTEGLRYLERNEEKLHKAASILTREKSPVQRLSDWAKLRVQMYDGLHSHSFSKP